MKGRYTALTALLCAALIAAGTLSFSLLYKVLFRPEAIIAAYSEEASPWREEQAQYAKAVLHPLSAALEAGSLAETEGEDLLHDFYHINPTLYAAVLELAGTSWDEVEAAPTKTYAYQPGTTECERWDLRELFQITLPDREILIAADKEHMPVLLLCGAEREAEESAAAEVRLSAAQGELPEGLPDELAKLDAALAENSSCFRLLAAMRSGSSGGGELAAGSFGEYGETGEWKVCADAQAAAYICIVGDYNFIVYYDATEGNFCGYSIALNELNG